MDIIALMDLATEIEETTAVLYRGFSNQFQSNPEGFHFWEEIARDEQRHADMIKVFRRKRLSMILPRKTHPKTGADFRLMLSEVRRKAGFAEATSIGQALQAALEVEQGLQRIHTSTCRGISDPMFVRLMTRLGDADTAHLHRIKAIARQFCDSH